MTYSLQDTAGQDEVKSLWDDWISEANAIILLYGVDSTTSFDKIQDEIYTQIIQNREEDLDELPM